VARDVLDRYYTPDALALECLRVTMALLPPDAVRVLEPHCGGGAFVRAARTLLPSAQLTTCDLDDVPAGARGDHHVAGDFLSADLSGCYDLIAGNPPFRDPWPHVRRGLSLLSSHGTVAYIMPLGRLAGRANALVVEELMPSLVAPITPRPSFTGGGSDMRDVALWLFGRRPAPHTLLGSVQWEKPTRRMAKQ